MKTRSIRDFSNAHKSSALIVLAVMASLTGSTYAVEGGLGRPVSGTTVMPYAGLVPPAPGFAASVGETYYDGSIGGGRSVPLAQNLVVDLDLNLSFTPISLLYIWDTGTNRWNFASGVTLPLAWVQADANVTVGPFAGRRKEDKFDLFDLAVVPIIASYHITPTDHLAFNFTVWAPTGEYDPNALANTSLNNWTFIPGLAYTKIFPKQNIEFTGAWNLQFYTENPDTDYENGILSDLELMAIKRFKCGAGIGVVGSWIEQITDDEGPTADRLDGFSGRAFGVGPILTYSTKLGNHTLDANARWIHEFENENRVEGDAIMLNLTLKF